MAIEQSGRSPLVVRDTRPEIASLHNRDGWNIKEQDFSGDVRDLIGLAVLAPSSHNTQPWRFDVDTIEGKAPSITLSPDLQRELPASDPTRREMYISVGAASEFLKIAGRYFGYDVKEEVVEDKERDVLGKKFTFETGYEPTEEDKKLFHAITARVSNRNNHTDEPVSQEFKDSMQNLERPDGVNLNFIDDKERLGILGDLVKTGDIQILTNEDFVTELAQHIKEYDDPSGSGMTMDSLGLTNKVEQRFVIPAIRAGKLADRMPEEDRQRIAEKTASVGVITTEEDNAAAWLGVGEQYARIALEATAEGMSANVMAVLVETGDLPGQLAGLIGEENRRPQLMFRLGYPEAPTVHSARRRPFEAIAVGRGEERHTIHENNASIFTLQEGGYELEDLVRELGGDVRIRDQYRAQVIELVQMESMDLTGDNALDLIKQRVAEKGTSMFHGKWVYFPWSHTIEHILDREDFYRVRFSRNIPIVPEEIQMNGIRNMSVGYIGLSIGAQKAEAAVKLGVEHVKLADFDVMELSNGARTVADSLGDIGENKSILLKRRFQEFNPYMKVDIYPAGLNKNNLREFIAGLDVVVDHMDGITLKRDLRALLYEKSQAGEEVPGLQMSTATGMDPIDEYEQPGARPFNGRFTDKQLAQLGRKQTSKAGFIREAISVIGMDNITEGNANNFREIILGNSNVVAQLGMAGNALAARHGWVLYMKASGREREIPGFSKINIGDPRTETSDDRKRLSRARQGLLLILEDQLQE